jgi:hypothetical protein
MATVEIYEYKWMLCLLVFCSLRPEILVALTFQDTYILLCT